MWSPVRLDQRFVPTATPGAAVSILASWRSRSAAARMLRLTTLPLPSIRNMVGTETIPYSFASRPSMPPVSWICDQGIGFSVRKSTSDCFSASRLTPMISKPCG